MLKYFATGAPAAPHSHGTCSVTTLLGQGRRLVRESFRLHADQERSLQDAAPAKVKEIQHFFTETAHHLRHGGKLTARIIKLPAAKQTTAAVHELHVDVETAAMSPQLSVVVAQCDAHCRNWGWGPG